MADYGAHSPINGALFALVLSALLASAIGNRTTTPTPAATCDPFAGFGISIVLTFAAVWFAILAAALSDLLATPAIVVGLGLTAILIFGAVWADAHSRPVGWQ